MNLIFDGNYLFHRSYSIFSTYYRDQDMATVLADKDNQQIFIRKCIMDFCATLQRFRDVTKVVFVIDSHSWRYSLHEDYKYALTKVKDPYYKYFLDVLNQFEALLRKKGMIVSRVKGSEGDDLLYIWSLYYGYILDEQMVIITGDSDIRQIITDNVSLFNNNSKNMKIHCLEENVNYWNDYFDGDIEVEAVVPFEVLLYKVIMGDTSDNVPKIKKGFGDVAFGKFIEHIKPYEVKENIELIDLAQWITSRFCDFAKMDEVVVLGQVLFNLKLTWLNLSVYNNTDYITENAKGLLENMLDDLNKQKDSYRYRKAFTLEQFYGMLLK